MGLQVEEKANRDTSNKRRFQLVHYKLRGNKEGIEVKK